MLSVRARVVLSLTSKNFAMHSWWNKLTAIYSLLFVTLPLGFLQDTSDAKIYAGKCALNTMVYDPVGLGI